MAVSREKNRGLTNGSDKDRALDLAVAQIEKQFGRGSIMKLGETPNMVVDVIPTGSLGLDLALGIGGLPKGRIVEIFGPESSGKSSLCLHVVAEAQKLGGIAAFIDAEHALDVGYARNLGVNVDELLVSQPDTGEQGLEIADMLVRSNAVDVIIVDSVAALVPRAEIEGEMGDTHIGLQARLMSQALRKLAGNVSRSNTLIIFINQLREKIGVMFGCMSGDTRVTLADGSSKRIDAIVRNRLPVEVLSYDLDLDAVVPKKVVNWFDNGPTNEFLTFKLPRVGGHGYSGFSCTPNHKIRTPSGWRESHELRAGDRVLYSAPHYLSDFQWEVLLGGLLGDSSLSPNQNGHAARLRWGHGVRQADYSDWKASLFANVGVCRSTNEKSAVFHDLKPLAELNELRRAVYFEGEKVFSYDYLKKLTPLSLAIWYQDDGTFQLRSKGVQKRTVGGTGRSEICLEAMEPATRERLTTYLADTWGIRAKLITRAGQAVMQFPKEATDKFHALIAPFVYPSMEYKLLPKYRGKFVVKPVFVPVRYELLPLPITNIRPKVLDSGQLTHRYDIEVEGSHNYFVDGVMVHNSPETTPGGRALKFYSSVRLDIRRIENLKDGAEVVGSRVRVKVVKSKVSAPFRQTEFDVMYGHGISKEGSLLDTAVEQAIVSKSGAWYLFDGDQIGQGRENTKAFLAEHPDVYGEIEQRVKQALNLTQPAPEPAEEPDESSVPN